MTVEGDRAEEATLLKRLSWFSQIHAHVPLFLWFETHFMVHWQTADYTPLG